MSAFNPEIVVLLLLILANAVFALAEIAIVSARQARLASLAADGNKGAGAALVLKDDPDQFLATVQVGITLIGVLTGAFGGATLTEKLAAWLAQFPAVAPYRGGVALAVVVSIITYLSLVIGELVPKRLGLSNPERFAATLAPPMQLLARWTRPAVLLLSWSTSLVTRLLGMRSGKEPAVTEEELRVMLQQGAQEGVIEAAEHEMVEAVFRFADRRVGSLATPRRDLVWLDAGSTEEEVREFFAVHPFSRVPLCDGSPDHVLGVISTRRLLLQLLTGKPLDLRLAMDEPLYVPETVRAAQLLETLRTTRSQFAVIVDEHGGTHGIVTATDLLEAIVGDLPDQYDEPEDDIQVREDGSWLVEGSIPLDELRDRLHIAAPPDTDAVTLGGLVLNQMGRIPTAGEFFHLDDYRFEVVDMDGRRVDKVLISRSE